MDFSKKLTALRKRNTLTQEQLAEELSVSRQSISKWESAQANPELDKIVALSNLFQVTTDYLLKPSESEELSLKTEEAEKQQQKIHNKRNKKIIIQQCQLYCFGICCLFFAVYSIGHYYFEIWNPSVIFAEALVFIAVAVFLCIQIIYKKEEN